MQNAVTDFLLAPDGSGSRRVRKMLAAEAPGLYRIAGSWAELLSQAHAAYLLPPENPTWPDKLAECAARQTEGFWSASLQVAPEETLAELDAALQRLIEGAGPKADWPAFINKLQPSRLHTRFAQLFELLSRIDTLPEPFRTMEAVIHAAHPPLRPLRVHSLPDLPALNAWQQAVLNRLAADAPPPDSQMQQLLTCALKPAGTSNPALLAARALYRPLDTPARPNHSLRVLSARDRLEEIEVAAGMIQKFIHRGGRPDQYGLLLPADAFTLQTVDAVFARFGLALSGLQRSLGQRDLGKEAVRLLLLGLRRPAPLMSIAALLTSPLMPWSMTEGQDYAQAVMDGDVLLKDKKLDAPARKLMDMLAAGADSVEHLQQHLASFRRLLESGDGLLDHRRRALACVDEVLPALPDMNELDWDALLSQAKPQSIHTAAERAFWQEAVAVFHEGFEPWRTVRHLVVIGFNDGHFPAGGRASAVFTEAEWEAIAQLGWKVPTAESNREQQRALFARQIAAAADSLTLLFSRRAADGKPLEPSSSLVFLARRFGTEPDELVLELGRREDRQQIAELATAAPKQPVSPRRPAVQDLDLQVDLLQAFGPAPDKPASLSPSAADTLMVSPFAWLLGRLGCEPRPWATDELDPMTAGTLAHRVFEHLFPAGKPLIGVTAIARQAPAVLNQFTLQLAPFLRSPDWRVERLKLEAEIVTAAVRWRQLLASWNAEIIGSEQWLQGRYNDIALRGQSDLLLQLPAGKVLVVDYKKSGSFKRRQRMRSRFDLQAHLYRLMIQSGGLPALKSIPADVGVLYYLLNDQTALSDSAISADGAVPGLEVIDADISSAAMQHLERRLDEIRTGNVRLNTTADEDWWDKNAGIRLYALDNSPLLRLFMHDAEVAA